MNLEKYNAISNPLHDSYEFLSEGPKGTIKKVVTFTEIQPDIYNLGFGDWDESTQSIKDNIRSNNKDRDKVLSTVAAIVIDFMNHHAGAMIFAKGETASKTRLYQMGINANWHEIGRLLIVEGYRKTGWELFVKTNNYDAFLIRTKQNL